MSQLVKLNFVNIVYLVKKKKCEVWYRYTPNKGHFGGIVRHFTVPGKPQQNEVAERMNQTLTEKVRCILSQAGLSKAFWVEALS